MCDFCRIDDILTNTVIRVYPLTLKLHDNPRYGKRWRHARNCGKIDISAVKECKQVTVADRSVTSVTLGESEIRGAKLEKNREELRRAETERWLKGRGCRNLSEFTPNSRVNIQVSLGGRNYLFQCCDFYNFDRKLSDWFCVVFNFLSERINSYM